MLQKLLEISKHNLPAPQPPIHPAMFPALLQADPVSAALSHLVQLYHQVGAAHYPALWAAPMPLDAAARGWSVPLGPMFCQPSGAPVPPRRASLHRPRPVRACPRAEPAPAGVEERGASSRGPSTAVGFRPFVEKKRDAEHEAGAPQSKKRKA